MTFSVRNSSSHGQRIRIKAPSSMYFALNYTPTGVIAPGIELRAEIECQFPENVKEGRFTDKIVITMESTNWRFLDRNKEICQGII